MFNTPLNHGWSQRQVQIHLFLFHSHKRGCTHVRCSVIFYSCSGPSALSGWIKLDRAGGVSQKFLFGLSDVWCNGNWSEQTMNTATCLHTQTATGLADSCAAQLVQMDRDGFREGRHCSDKSSTEVKCIRLLIMHKGFMVHFVWGNAWTEDGTNNNIASSFSQTHWLSEWSIWLFIFRFRFWALSYI